MNFTLIGDYKELLTPISLLCDEYDFKITDDGMPVHISHSDDGLYVSYDGSSAKIAYNKKIEFFRAWGLLLEAIADGKTEFTKTEVPYFETCGGMYDLSHGALVTVDALKYTIRKMAMMGLDMFMMYSEESYDVSEYPYFGYMRGRYTYDEIKEIDDYAYQFGIEIIPAMQTLGHLSNTLRWSCFGDIADTGDCLLVGEEKTYEFVENLLRAATAPVRSKRIHIGFDETMSLGTGNYMVKHGHRPRIDIYMEHLIKVAEICEKMGLTALIWSDMFFRLKGSAHGYGYDNIEIPDDIISKIPHNIELVNASYGPTDVESYKTWLKAHIDSSREVHFAGAVHDWHGFCVNYRHTFPASDAALIACKELSIKSAFATTWGDDSTERDILTNLLGFQQYAEHCYNIAPSIEDVCKRYNYCVQNDANMIIGISNIDIPDAKNLPDIKSGDILAQFDMSDDLINPSKYLMWQDPLLGQFDTELKKCNYKEHFRQRGEYLRTFVGKYPEWDSSLNFYIALCDVLEDKCTIGVDIKKAYDEKNTDELIKIADIRIPKLIEKLRDMWLKNRVLWFDRHKPYGWEVLERRYGCLSTRLETTAFRLKEYCAGNIDRIEELDEARLPFRHNDNGNILYYNDYLHTSTAWGR